MKNSRENIFSAALELFSRQGFYRTTVSQIAKRAGLSDGAIYRHFPGKYELAAEIYSEVMTGLIETFKSIRLSGADFTGKIEAVIELLFQTADEHPQKINFIFFLKHSEFLSSQQMRMIQQISEEIAAVIREGIDNDEIIPVDPRLGAAMIIGSINKLIEMRNFKLIDEPLINLKEDCLNLFMTGFRKCEKSNAVF
ncbi:TetR/AcrR family transcriptional regulator [bacterium]|nr:TetR/AcrR family transcriptional regulator [FCB group bacterium]MBL7190548.1 TetR/AcrR family transcriptional regulator [bacterium]